jgi:hypothetical protein
MPMRGAGVIDELGNQSLMDVRIWPFLPNYFYKEIKSILVSSKHSSSNGTRKMQRMSVRTMEPIYHSNLYSSKELNDRATRLKNVHVVHTITKKGMGILYSDRKESEHMVPKVLLNFNEIQYPYNDYKGEYGMSQLTFGIPIHNKKEGDELIEYINSTFFKEVIKATKWGVFYTNYKMFSYFRFPKLKTT